MIIKPALKYFFDDKTYEDFTGTEYTSWNINSDHTLDTDNDFVGITGDSEKIFLLSQSWGIVSQKIFLEDGEYNVDHSSPVILLKEGKYVGTISHHDDIKKSLKKINKYL